MKMKQDLEIIKELMDELIVDMSPKGEDFSERLGKKPMVAAIEMEAEGEEEPMEEMGEYDEDEEEFMPGNSLKRRIQKLRG